MKLFKLTDRSMQTHGGTQWTLGEWKETNGSGELCSAGWLHAYRDPYLALLLNPIHADFSNPRLFEVEWDGEFLDDNGLKCGVTRLRLIKEIDGIFISTEERVEFAIRIALKVYKNEGFVEWATHWLDGSDRGAKAATEARAAARAAWAAAWAAAEAAERAALAALAALAAVEAAERAALAAARAAARAAAWAAARTTEDDLVLSVINEMWRTNE